MAAAYSSVPAKKGRASAIVVDSSSVHSLAAVHCTHMGHAHLGTEIVDLCCATWMPQSPLVVVAWVQLEVGRPDLHAETPMPHSQHMLLNLGGQTG